MSAINSVHQSNAQALAQIQAQNQVSEDRLAADSERLAKLAEARHQQVVESARDASTEKSLDTVV